MLPVCWLSVVYWHDRIDVDQVSFASSNV